MGVTSATGGNGKSEGIVWLGGNRVVATIGNSSGKKKQNVLSNLSRTTKVQIYVYVCVCGN